MFVLLCLSVYCVFLARLQTWRAIIFSRVCLSVCLCVCLWPALLPFNVNWFWWNLVTRTLLWFSLAATRMVQIGRRIRISKFWSIIFLRLCLLCVVKKIWLNSNKTDGGDRFWSLPLWQFRQWHCCSSTTFGGIFWLNQWHGGMQRLKPRGIPNWGTIGP